MKKFISAIICAIIPLLLCTGCEASNAEIANSLDGNMTRLVYSIGYLDSVSVGEMNDLMQNSAYFNNTNNPTNSAMTNFATNGFRSNTFYNSVNQNLNGGIEEPTKTSISTENNLTDSTLCDTNSAVSDSTNTGNATTSTLGGLCNDSCSNYGTKATQPINSETNSVLTGISANNVSLPSTNLSATNNGNLVTNSNSLTNNNVNDSTLNGTNTTTFQINNSNTSNETSTLPATYVDTSLLMTSANDLNEILMLISQKRGIIMLYCTDLRSGNGTLTIDEKNAISEYIAIIKETTNYLNTYSNTLTTYMNNIKTIAYTEDSQELVNAKLIRANEILKTRYAKLDTCIDSLDAIIAILQRCVGMDYSANYINNYATNQNILGTNSSVNNELALNNFNNQNNCSNNVCDNLYNENNNLTNNNLYNNQNNSVAKNDYTNSATNNEVVTPSCPCKNYPNTTTILQPESETILTPTINGEQNNYTNENNSCVNQNCNTPMHNQILPNISNIINSSNTNNSSANSANIVQPITPKADANLNTPALSNSSTAFNVNNSNLSQNCKNSTQNNTLSPTEPNAINNTNKNIEQSASSSSPNQNIFPRPENIISEIKSTSSSLVDSSNISDDIIKPNFVDTNSVVTDRQKNEILPEQKTLQKLTTNKTDTTNFSKSENTAFVKNQTTESLPTKTNTTADEDCLVKISPAPVVHSYSKLATLKNEPRINDETTIQFLPFKPKFD